MIDWAALSETYGRSCDAPAAIGAPCFRKHAMEWELRVSPITITRPFTALKIGGPVNISNEAGWDGCEPGGWNVQIHLGAHQITPAACCHPQQERRRTPMTQLVFAIPVGG